MTYGEGLSHWRRNLSLRQWQVAETLHVTRQTISNWENDVSYPDLESLFILSRKYHTSVNDILGQDYGGGGASKTDSLVASKTKKDLFHIMKQILFFTDKYNL